MAKKLLNKYESLVNDRLRKICEESDANVFPKVRLADILPIESSGISGELFRFALQSHFDFLITDADVEPLFAVEFDGPSHQGERQQARDKRKDALCELFKFPLLRINSRYLTTSARGMDLLTWVIETWFNAKAFYEAQEQGHIPRDEDFSPWMLMGRGDGPGFPYWLSLEAQNRLRHFHQQGIVMDSTVSHWIGEDKRGRRIGLGWIRISDSNGVIVRTGMRAANFDFYLNDLLDDLVMIETISELEAVLRKEKSGTPLNQLQVKLHRWTDGLIMQTCGGTLDTLAISPRTKWTPRI